MKFILIFLLVCVGCYHQDSDIQQKDQPREIGREKEKFFNVWATRIGLVGETTASGHIIEEDDVFVALPSRSVLHREVEVFYGRNSIKCLVKDVGPWSTRDEYWEKGTRPAAEVGKRLPFKGKTRNKAGIDLSDGLWENLGIPRKIGVAKVKWRFIE